MKIWVLWLKGYSIIWFVKQSEGLRLKGYQYVCLSVCLLVLIIWGFEEKIACFASSFTGIELFEVIYLISWFKELEFLGLKGYWFLPVGRVCDH